jgi:hypothetical protein
VLTSIAEVAAASSDKGKVDCDQVAQALLRGVKGR